MNHKLAGADEQPPELLRLEHVSKRFGGVQALDDISFNVIPGEVLCLAGENGCGKSTLIKTISGVHQPEPGAIMQWDGKDMLGLGPSQAREMGIQVIWQDLALFPEMSVAENIAFEQNLGTRVGLVNYATMRQKAADLLQRLGVSIDLDVRVASLSIANRQLVAIARALIADARLVFMDEPTASLSRHETEALITIVRKLSEQNIAVVFVSHRLAEVLDICTRVTVLRDGRYVGTYSTKDMTQSRLTELMTGQSFDYQTRPVPAQQGAPLLEVKNLSRSGEYHNVDLDIRPGEIVGLTGLLGAGRTELALSLFGMRRPDEGQIVFEGKPLHMASNRDAIKAGIAYVSEDRLSLGLIQQQPIGDNTAITVLGRLLNPLGLLSPKKKQRLVDDWIHRLKVKIGDTRDPISSLSGGNQQRIVLAKWLATEPKLLILDSPTVGVDVGARAGIFEIVTALAEQGVAILLISDEIPEVYFNSDRVLHMRDGRLIEEFTPATTELTHIEEAVHA
ncbi:sugar ABC transporter ATP-binding protein [Halomonas sp. G11]|uniref:sugar ABC transporter ATP-binding protein n=1 Tax=Halomonas sp. G11 TaxID=1684425 RepID=UPI0008018566|nr:sugar ABC transporter ATP-binding protein [Halomonas sp. G11]OBA00440.1 lipase [Halomonas sp. G11]